MRLGFRFSGYEVVRTSLDKGDHWYLANDSIIRKVSEGEVLQRAEVGYIYDYEKIS